MKMKKQIVAAIMSAGLCLMSESLIAQGYPVFDSMNWMGTIDTVMNTYDQIENTITQIENQYKMIQHAIEVAKSIDWENIKFDGDFDIRNDIKNAASRVNRMLNQVRNIKEALTTPSINFGNVKYSVADLCAVGGDPDKNVFSAVGDYAKYIGENMKKAVDCVVQGMTDEQKKAIAAKYGISPRNYAMIQSAKNGVKKAAGEVLASVAEKVAEDNIKKYYEKTEALFQACATSTDENGNITQNGWLETIARLNEQLGAQILELQAAINKSSEVAAQKAMLENTEETARNENEKKQNDMHEVKNTRFSARAKRMSK